MLPIHAPCAATVQVLSSGGSETAPGSILSFSGHRVVIESPLRAGIRSALQVWCEGHMLLCEVVDESVTAAGACQATAEVLHVLDVDATSGHSRFW